MGTSLAIAVVHDGVALQDGQERPRVEEVIDLLLACESPTVATLYFYTEGVRWVTSASPLVERLRELQARGVEVRVCRSCLREAGLLEDVRVGRLVSQDSIQDELYHAEHVVVL